MSASPVLIFSGRGCERLPVSSPSARVSGPGDRAPEQIGRRRDKTVRGKFVGEIAQVLVDAVDGTREHHRRHRPRRLGHRDITIEIAARAPVDLDSLARHGVLLPLLGRTLRCPSH